MDTHQTQGSVLTDTVSALQTLLLSTPDIHDFLTEVARLAADSVAPPAAVGISTSYDGDPITRATSDSRAALVDELQYSGGEGPCLEAMRTGKFVEVEDQAIDERWPIYRPHAIELGVQCSLSYPLIAQDRVVGVLNLYGLDRQHGFTHDDQQRGDAFATQVVTSLALAVRFAKQVEIADQLEQALTSRSVIDQAIGVLMAQQRCDDETAFGLLRTHSQHNNRKLRDVAADIITRYTGHAPIARPRFNHAPKGAV